MNIFIMGAPGSGKGTFSNRIKEQYNLNHISTGDIFRQNISEGTDLGKQAQSFIEQGKLVPDSITNQMVADYLANLKDPKNGYLLDGYPRTLDQAHAFEKLTENSHQGVDLILNMDVPADVLTKRITGRRTCKNCGEIYNIYYKAPAAENTCDHCGSVLSQRKDDNEESLKTRLDEYFSNTQPVIDYYASKGMSATIDANQDIEAIWPQIQAVLNKVE